MLMVATTTRMIEVAGTAERIFVMRLESRIDRCFLSRHFLCWLVFGSVLTGRLVAPAQEQPPASGFRDRTAELGLQLANTKACWVDVDNDG